MTTQQEIKKILKDRATSIVDERIVPEALDAVAEWTGELMGKLTTLNAEDQQKTDKAFNQLYEGLAKETLKQLVESLEKKKLLGKK